MKYRTRRQTTLSPEITTLNLSVYVRVPRRFGGEFRSPPRRFRKAGESTSSDITAWGQIRSNGQRYSDSRICAEANSCEKLTACSQPTDEHGQRMAAGVLPSSAENPWHAGHQR